MLSVLCWITVILVGVSCLRTTLLPTTSRGSGVIAFSRKIYVNNLNRTQNIISKNENSITTTTPIDQATCPPCTCGALGLRSPKIIGGKPTYINKYPWMATLMIKKMVFCGASLINDKYVLTAAHCVHRLNIKHLHVRLLEHNWSTDKESKHMDFKVLKAIIHEKYNHDTSDNDIALLRLDTEGLKFDLDSIIRPVCLPQNDGLNYAGYDAIITGWGMTTEDGSMSRVLREVHVPIISNRMCRDETSYNVDEITDNMMCAGFRRGNKDACKGDSGGPLHVKIKSAYYVVGIVSWGYGCGDAFTPGVYCRVSKFINWVAQNTKDACQCPNPNSTL